MGKWCTATVVLILIIACASTASAQVFSDKLVGEKGRALADSLKEEEYPYALPIWGDKATARGFKLPYSAGVSLQYFGQRSDLLIDNLMVGFNNNAMYELDGLVRFDKAKSSSDGISLRPDIWLFPFLNVYAILGRSSASTEVGYGLWLPDSTGAETEIFHSGTTVDFDANTFGLGLTPTIGVGGGWMALDMNYTWTDVPQLDEPATAFVFDPRIGKSFRLRNADENINVWVGGFRLKINTGTTGSIPLTDAIPIDELQSNVNEGIEEVARRNEEIEAWWNSLSPPEQANPVNKAKYETSKAALERAGTFLDSANTALTNASSATVEYSIDKRPEDMWNFMVGSQYQINKSWMLRLEVGFLSSRTHLITGVQYRFGL